jgi:hypothetical protein
MRDDLLDAYAAVEWAIAQLPTLERRIEEWRDDKPYTMRIDTDSRHGKKLYRLAGTKQPPPVINAEAGAIINSLRSSLDILANALAERNGQHGHDDVYFPVSASLAAFLETRSGGGMEKIKRLSAADQAVIKGLSPYKGGNDLLFALHRLDVTRKHKRLLDVVIFPRGVMFAGVGFRDITFTTTWKGFEDEAVIAWTDAATPDAHIEFPVYVAFKEAGAVEGHQVAATLGKFTSLAKSIVALFDK